MAFTFFKNVNLTLKRALATYLPFIFAKKRHMEEKDINQTDTQVNDNTEEININADDSIPGTSHLSDEMEEDGELDKLRGELQEQKDKYLRLFAEFDNYKRRTAKERIETIQTAGREVITSMLDVLDDLERAEKQMQSTTDANVLKEGVSLVFNKLRTTLQSKGLKPMESISTDFDTEKHEAITEIPAPNETLKGKVVDEVTKGYYLNDKLIRHAKVVVGK
jgi:molecular chaperone GrpE